MISFGIPMGTPMPRIVLPPVRDPGPVARAVARGGCSMGCHSGVHGGAAYALLGAGVLDLMWTPWARYRKLASSWLGLDRAPARVEHDKQQ
eukprot:scaffold3187_cov361-Prasinococcus_capsulatus_cf.AAC.14